MLTVIIIENGQCYAKSNSESIVASWKKNQAAWLGGVQVLKEPSEANGGEMIIAVPLEWAIKSAKFLIPRPKYLVPAGEADKVIHLLDSANVEHK